MLAAQGVRVQQVVLAVHQLLMPEVEAVESLRLVAPVAQVAQVAAVLVQLAVRLGQTAQQIQAAAGVAMATPALTAAQVVLVL